MGLATTFLAPNHESFFDPQNRNASRNCNVTVITGAHYRYCDLWELITKPPEKPENQGLGEGVRHGASGGWGGAMATPQTHRLRPWSFPAVSPSHPGGDPGQRENVSVRPAAAGASRK